MALHKGQIAREIAEMHVFSELLKRGVAVYRPVVDADVNALAKLSDGQVLELIIKSSAEAERKGPRQFQMPDYRPSPNLFVLCVTVQDAQVEAVWTFPSMVFYAYSTGSGGKRKMRNLDLDSGEEKYDAPLWEYLRGFRNRWGLITEYANYRKFMTSPEGFEDLEDIVTAKESFESPEDEKIPWEEYVRSVAEKVSN